MRLILFLALLLLLPHAAFAQLETSDPADPSPGDSCSTFPQGASMLIADRDFDGKDVVLICDGTNWIAAGTSNGGGDLLGTWEGKTLGTVYQADTDGLVVAKVYVSPGDRCSIRGSTDSANPPTTEVVTAAIQDVTSASIVSDNSFTMPVKNGDYWRVTVLNGAGDCSDTVNVRWIPLMGGGSGGGSGSASSIIDGWPDAIVCSNGTITRVMFASMLPNNSAYVYRNVVNTQQIEVGFTSAGAYSYNTTMAGYDCVTNAWSISDLYANDRAFNFIGGGSGSASSMVDGWPDNIMCQGSNGDYWIMELHSIASGTGAGDVVYNHQGMTSRYIRFNSDGSFDSVTGDAFPDCSGKSISTLYSDGQAFN